MSVRSTHPLMIMSTYRTATLIAVLCIAIALPACSQKASSAAPDEDQRLAASGSSSPVGGSAASPCKPVETRNANAASQEPAFAGQTRACSEPTNVAFDLIVLARGLENPWAVEPLPDGDLLVTEKPGRMRIISAAGEVGQPIAGVLPVDARGQGGLLDVALSPEFASDRTIFWSFTEPRQGGNGTSVARGVLSEDRRRLDSVRVIFRALPTYANNMHFGSRIVFGRDGMLYLTLGERSDRETRPQAQHLDSHLGKIIRITPEGAVPPDNPFVGRSDARPEIWALGFRNVQSAALDGEGRFWSIEHGPKGGDELNLIEKGRNYGWPVVTFGEEYSGLAIRGAETTRDGFVDPVYYWDPVIAPSGAQFYSGKAFPAWRGSLFVGALREERLVRLSISNGRVTGEEHLLTDRGQRVRDVREGPDGALYVVTDEENGALWKLAPRR